MFYRAKSNQYVVEGMPFEVDGIHYPANWLNLSSPQDKQSLGLQEVVIVGVRKDDRYYWVSESLEGAVLTIKSTPKDLETVRKTCIDGLKASAYSLLFPTDWMITRKAEVGTPIPSDWEVFRDNVRLECGMRVDQAQIATTVDEIAAITPNWPLDPNAPIVEVSNAPQEGI